MARLPRLAVAGELHLVLLRGHSDQAVFADDADRASFLALVREAATRHEVAIHAYALLVDQVHLLVTPSQAEGLGRMMQSIGRRYVAAFNRRHARRGTLWDGRFRSGIVDAGAHLMNATMYVETLPVAAGLVAAAEDWPWSSAAHHVGRRRDGLVVDHQLYWSIGNTPFEREHAHTVLLTAAAQQGGAGEGMMAAVTRGKVVGPASFVARISDALGRPVTARPRGRPRRDA